MALINCPECSKQISDKANSCPNCGCPISQGNQNKGTPSSSLACPVLHWDLSIGKNIHNLSGNTTTEGFFYKEENVITDIPEGKIQILLHEKGIDIRGNYFSAVMELHQSQIIDIIATTDNEMIEMEKSVIGRAVVGFAAFTPFGPLGPLAAIVGAISGVGTTKKKKSLYVLIISFWDAKTKEPKSLFIRSDERFLSGFVATCKKYLNIQSNSSRTFPDHDHDLTERCKDCIDKEKRSRKLKREGDQQSSEQARIAMLNVRRDLQKYFTEKQITDEIARLEASGYGVGFLNS